MRPQRIILVRLGQTVWNVDEALFETTMVLLERLGLRLPERLRMPETGLVAN